MKHLKSRFKIMKRRQILIIILVCLLELNVFDGRSQTVTETPMMRGLGVGTHFGSNSNWDVDKVLPLLKQMGVSVLREGGPEWATVERSKGIYTIPPYAQHWFDEVTKSGIRVVLAFMRENRIYENSLDPDAYARWVEFMARNWKYPQVCAYEIWNEPDGFDFPDVYGRKKDDWLPKYCEMVRKASVAIRNVNPDAVILQNVECNYWFDALQKYPEDFAQVDGMDLHPYPKRNPPESSDTDPPVSDAQHSMLSYVTISARDYPKKYLGRELQMWVGEFGYPAMKDMPGDWMGVSDEVQAAYNVRGMLLGLHGGVKVWCIYDFVNDGTSPSNVEDNFGLVRNINQNYEPKPAFYAIQRVARLMGPDWQIADNITARLDVDTAALPVPKDVPARKVVTGPENIWFRVGNDYITYVWNAGWYIEQPNPPLGQIVWTNAPKVMDISAQDLVTGKKVDVHISKGKNIILSGVPVGSNPIAIRWVAK
jgi:hypothetical protein